jgi:hypothetical protein
MPLSLSVTVTSQPQTSPTVMVSESARFTQFSGETQGLSLEYEQIKSRPAIITVVQYVEVNTPQEQC